MQSFRGRYAACAASESVTPLRRAGHHQLQSTTAGRAGSSGADPIPFALHSRAVGPVGRTVRRSDHRPNGNAVGAAVVGEADGVAGGSGRAYRAGRRAGCIGEPCGACAVARLDGPNGRDRRRRARQPAAVVEPGTPCGVALARGGVALARLRRGTGPQRGWHWPAAGWHWPAAGHFRRRAWQARRRAEQRSTAQPFVSAAVRCSAHVWPPLQGFAWPLNVNAWGQI
jgi:hypothetical protein